MSLLGQYWQLTQMLGWWLGIWDASMFVKKLKFVLGKVGRLGDYGVFDENVDGLEEEFLLSEACVIWKA